MEQLLQVEKQLRDLRVSLKWIACIISPLLTFKLFGSVASISITAGIFTDLGDALLPGLFKLFTGYPLITKSLSLFSLFTFIALLFTCYRHRNLLFLYLFAASLAIHLILITLITLIDFADKLPYYKVMRDMSNP